MKKILALCLVVVLAVTAITGATLAYFTDNDEATNTITVGNVQIELDEPSWVNNPEVYPGQELAKDPTVTNTGSNTCYVRVSVEGLDILGDDNMITFKTGDAVGVLGENWVEGEDDYFYYTVALDEDEATTALFEEIVIPTTLTNADGLEFEESYDIDIVAEAIQADGFENYEAAWEANDAE